MWTKWQSLALWKQVFIGLALGIATGLILHYGLGAQGKYIAQTWFYPFGKAFVNLIKMLVVPLIATTLISGVIAMGDPKRLGSLGARTIALYMLTTFFAVWLGLGFGTLLQPGTGLGDIIAPQQDSIVAIGEKLEKSTQAGGITDRLLAIIPANPINALAQGDVIAIIFFSILFGVGILLVGENAKPVAALFDASAAVMMRITTLVMALAPYGVFALMAWVLGVNGLGILVNMGQLALALYLACFAQIILVYGGLIVKTILKMPMKRFFFGIADAIGVAYSTASSNATLPVSISCARQNLGVERSIASSVLPLGATINMDGTAIYLGIIALFAAQALGIDLQASDYLAIALSATLTSIGAAGIPSAGLLLAASVLAIIGVSDTQAVLVIAFIYPFDRLLDMMRTATNVSGDIAIACTVAKWEGVLDEEVFKNPARL